MNKLDVVKKAIKEYPDFPKKGILFQDIFGVLLDPEANLALNDLAVEHVKEHSDNFDKIVGLDSRGFLFGNTMALAVRKPFVPIRKKGKLPGRCISVAYSLEYGEDVLEIQEGSIQPGDRVLIVDDLLATGKNEHEHHLTTSYNFGDLYLLTGGTLTAAASLIKKTGGVVDHCWVVIELAVLRGREKTGEKITSLISLEDVE